VQGILGYGSAALLQLCEQRLEHIGSMIKACQGKVSRVELSPGTGFFEGCVQHSLRNRQPVSAGDHALDAGSRLSRPGCLFQQG